MQAPLESQLQALWHPEEEVHQDMGGEAAGPQEAEGAERQNRWERKQQEEIGKRCLFYVC